MDYADLQVQTPIRPGVIDISNAAQATINGVELEFGTRLLSSVSAGGHLALARRQLRQLRRGGGRRCHRRRRRPSAQQRARVVGSCLGRVDGCDRPAPSRSRLRADGRSQTTVFFTPFNDTIQRQRPYGLLDVNAQVGTGVRGDGPWQPGRAISRTPATSPAAQPPPPAIGGRPGVSREVGVQLALRWTSEMNTLIDLTVPLLTFLTLTAVGLDLTLTRRLRPPPPAADARGNRAGRTARPASSDRGWPGMAVSTRPRSRREPAARGGVPDWRHLEHLQLPRAGVDGVVRHA